MSRTAAKFTQADLARAVRAARSCGDDMAVDLRPDGTIRIFRLTDGRDRIARIARFLSNRARFGEICLIDFKRLFSAFPKPSFPLPAPGQVAP